MKKIGALVPAVFLSVVFGSFSPVFGERIPIPEGVFYYKPAASVFGAEAAWINPARLGKFRTASYQFMGDFHEGTALKSWGTVVVHDQLAVAYRYLANEGEVNAREYLFGTGFTLGQQLNFGVSYRYFKEAPGIYNKRHFWNIGLSGGGRGPFQWGAVFSNLNRGAVNGVRTETEQRYSLSYRPLGNKMTISVDMFLSTKTKFSNADYTYHVEAEPRPGLFIEGAYTSDKDYFVGVRVNLRQYFTGVQSLFHKGSGHRRTTTYVGATLQRQSSLLSLRPRRLSLKLSGKVQENPPQPVFGKPQPSFISLVLSIYRAAEDASIREMTVELKNLSLGFAQAQELRTALQHFRRAGKKIICYLSSPDNIGYYIASAADSIIIPPVSQLNLVGLKAELTFFAGTLGKLGVKADLMQIGNYKTAAEQLTRESASEYNRQQVNRLLDNVYSQFVEAIAEGRKLTVDSVKTIIDNGPYTSKEALRYGLVDNLCYQDDFHECFPSRFPRISFGEYLRDTLLNDGCPQKPLLAVVVGEGEIDASGKGVNPFSRGERLTPSLMKRAFRKVTESPEVKGVIFRIDSPGGTVGASEDIYRAVSELASKKPLVTSMSNVAASGGYYIAMPGKYIFADAATITGSIGVFGGKMDLSNLYKKIRLGKELYTRGRFAGMLTTLRPFTPEERKKYFSHLSAFYSHFIDLVANNRRLPSDSIDALGQGRVWTGREALENGLVDEEGGIKQSLDFLAEKTRIDDYRIVIHPQKRKWFSLPGTSFLNMLADALGLAPSSSFSGLTDMSDFFEGEVFLARLPYDIEIK